MKWIVACILLIAPAWAGPASAPRAEIERLLAYVGALEGATFVRNGSEHSAAQAVSHLKLKWQKQEKKIATAEDFIALCASTSSTSGERYRIRFKDGKERFCDDLLREHLTALRAKGGGAKS